MLRSEQPKNNKSDLPRKDMHNTLLTTDLPEPTRREEEWVYISRVELGPVRGYNFGTPHKHVTELKLCAILTLLSTIAA